MVESVLPTDIEELGELVCSGEMTEKQIDEYIESHGHWAHDCETCGQILENFEDWPLVLLLEHNVSRMTQDQCELVHEKLDGHFDVSDQGTRANLAAARLRLAVGKGLLGFVREDLSTWLDEEFLDKTFSSEEILESVQDYLNELVNFEACDEGLLESFVSTYHNPGDWREGGVGCEGDFEACDSCQDMLNDAVAKLK
jgi:hypothetical protein